MKKVSLKKAIEIIGGTYFYDVEPIMYGVE